MQNLTVDSLKKIRNKREQLGIPDIDKEHHPESLDGFQSMIKKHLRMKEYALAMMRYVQLKHLEIAEQQKKLFKGARPWEPSKRCRSFTVRR